jgi:hypothetical protein
MISLLSMTAEKKADVGEWYSKLTDQQKLTMLAEDKDKAPSGSGYIVTLKLMHWHHDEQDPTQNGIEYVKRTLLRNLQQAQIQVPRYPVRDVRRMGITHVLIPDIREPYLVPYDPTGVLLAGQAGAQGSLYGGGAGPIGIGGYGGGGYGGGGYGGGGFGGIGRGMAGPAAGVRTPAAAGSDPIRKIHQTDCTVQFVFQPVAVDQRAPLQPAAEAGETPADPAASGETAQPAAEGTSPATTPPQS